MRQQTIRVAYIMVTGSKDIAEFLNSVMDNIHSPRYYLDQHMLVAVEDGNNPFTPATDIASIISDVMNIDNEIMSADHAPAYVIDPCMEEENDPYHHFHIAQLEREIDGAVIFTHTTYDHLSFRILSLE